MTKSIERQRATIARLVAERACVAAWPPSRTEAIERARVAVEAAAAAGRDRLNHTARKIAEGKEDASRFFVVASTLDVRRDGTAVNVLPILAPLFGTDALLQALRPSFDLLPEGMSAADKAAALAEIDAGLLAAEIEEERRISAEEAAGNPIERRADADPRAVLYMADPVEGDAE